MSLITLIRDYVDVANSKEQLDGYTLWSLTYHSIVFLLTVVKQAVFYCFTFNWLRDLSYFCLTPPLLLSSFTNVNGIGFDFVDKPLSHLLAFSDSNYSNGIGFIIVGFFNGCFSCMHFSAAHLVTIQRMLVQGVPAGLSSAFGTAVGQFSFLACVLFGFRGLLFPWLALEPLHFFVGVGILLSVASTMAQDRRTVTVQWSNKGSLLIYFFTTFLLAWCEQTAVFQWMGNLSFGAEPTLLETAPNLGTINSVFGNVQFLAQNISYLFAFFLGSVLGAFIIGFVLQRFLEFVLRQKGIAIYYGLVKQANLPLATLVFAFGFGSLPYYGFDYLITKGFGFVPHEPIFQQTFFSPVNLVSKTSQTKETSQGRLEDQLALLFTLEGERNKSFAVDTTPFDDGQYLKANQKRPQAFEDLNYRGEHLWTNRLSRISNIREQANQTQSSFLGPVFSWMRSFLWGDGPTTERTRERIIDTSSKNSGLLSQHQVTNNQLIGSNDSYVDKVAREAGLTPKGYKSQKEGVQSIDQIINKSKKPSDDLLDFMFQGESNKRRKELSPEREQIDNYVKEFDRQFDKGFSNFYDTDPNSLIEVEDQWQEKRIKDKCYTNPIYKFLLNTEIDSFLSRQPHSYLLSPQEENLLLKKRQLLSNYYDTLSLTNQVSNSEILGQFVPKSYANVIYNHQFKGTLKVARRLFSVKREVIGNTNTEKINAVSASQSRGVRQSRQETERKNRTVKFDQPLFSKEYDNVQQIVSHEELAVIQPYKDLNTSDQVITIAPQLDKKEKKKVVVPDKENIFLLEQAETSPLYAGWDDQLRKFTITNRFQSRALAGYTFSGFPTSYKESDGSSGSTESTQKTTIFTTWPIPNPLVVKNKDGSLTKQQNISENAYLEEIKNSYVDKVARENAEGVQTTKGNFLANNDFLDRKSDLIPPLDISNAERNSMFAMKNSSLRSLKNTGISNTDTFPLSDTNFNHLSLTESEYKPNDQDSDIHPEGIINEKPREVIGSDVKTNEMKNGKSQGGTTKSKPKGSDKIDLTSLYTGVDTNVSKKKDGLSYVDKVETGGVQKLKEATIDSINKSLPSLSSTSKNRFLFQSNSHKTPATNDMVNALLQWQKLIKENKQLSKEDKQAAKEKISYWPENIHRAYWSNEVIDNELEFDEPTENVFKKQTFLWEFIPPYHGGFVWSGNNWNN